MKFIKNFHYKNNFNKFHSEILQYSRYSKKSDYNQKERLEVGLDGKKEKKIRNIL